MVGDNVLVRGTHCGRDQRRTTGDRSYISIPSQPSWISISGPAACSARPFQLPPRPIASRSLGNNLQVNRGTTHDPSTINSCMLSTGHLVGLSPERVGHQHLAEQPLLPSGTPRGKGPTIVGHVAGPGLGLPPRIGWVARSVSLGGELHLRRVVTRTTWITSAKV